MTRLRRMRLLFAPTIVICSLCVCVTGMDCGGLQPSTPSFPRVTAWTPININVGGGALPTVLVMTDLNIDGLVDAVVGYPGREDSTAQLVVYLQATPTQWAGITIASGTSVSGVSSLAVADIDADGASDIVAGCANQIVIFRNPGGGSGLVGNWFSTILQSSASADIGRYTDVAVVQIDKALGLDIVACNNQPGLLAWFRSPPSPLNGAAWERFDIDNTSRRGATAILIDDLSRDGNPDIISTARGESQNTIAWYRHPADNVLGGQPGAWMKFNIGSLPEAGRMDMADLDRDGRNDLVAISTSQRRVGWYVRPENPETQAWSGFALADFTQNTPTQVKTVDVDRNGQPDVVVSTSRSGSLRWFTPVNDVKARWVENNLADFTSDCGLFSIFDVDRDGRPDVIAPLIAESSANDSVTWFLNPELQ